jgi:pyridinium-3,5-bisthiocarboxylic acid mononucleotide nickel chelatase
MTPLRVAYLDCSTGVSGDKFLGALLDAGTPGGEFTARHLRSIATALAPEARVDVEPVLSHGIHAMSVRVTAENDVPERTWRDIRELLEAAALPGDVRRNALRVFQVLADAEAVVHQVDVSDVHFHEVGAIDSIVDIVGVCAGLDALGIESITAGPVAVGSGTTEAAHGPLSVPAPATAALLLGMPITGGPVPGELTTPTGAALLRGLECRFGAVPSMQLDRSGFGAGTLHIGIPNVCQLLIGSSTTEQPATPSATPEPVVLLETNIDHIAAEELSFAAEELLGAGALDVWQTPIVMKKGRSATAFSALATPETADALTALMIELTGSLGVRHHRIERSREPRQSLEVATPWGPVRVKSGAGRLRPEHDDVARIAREQSLPYFAVSREITRLAEEPDAIDER